MSYEFRINKHHVTDVKHNLQAVLAINVQK